LGCQNIDSWETELENADVTINLEKIGGLSLYRKRTKKKKFYYPE
jgi:hypothetical protein